jgi:hypothetical protein
MTLYVAFGIIWLFHITAVGLGTYYMWIWGHYCTVFCSVPAPQKMLQLHYKHQPVNAVGAKITVHCENDAEHINIPCVKNSGFSKYSTFGKSLCTYKRCWK